MLPMATAMKEGLNSKAIERIAANMQLAWPQFPAKSFVTRAKRGLSALELKERVVHLANALTIALPDSFEEAVHHILKASETWDRGNPEDPLRGFAAWPLFHFIETKGLDHFDLSLHAFEKITNLFSAEFSIRPFIALDKDRAFSVFSQWTTHTDEHVRRLVSESTRSHLPWASHVECILCDPHSVLKLLERLKDDPALYVRRSVANNLNDIAKDHPELVIDRCEEWSKNASPERQWIIQRATRSLVKSGHPRVWGLLGFTATPKLKLAEATLQSPTVAIGDSLGFSFTLVSQAARPQRLVVDYAVYYTKANGSLRPKVFKLKQVELGAKQSVAIAKQHSFRKVTTRKLYPGPHRIEILVNGVVRATLAFEVT